MCTNCPTFVSALVPFSYLSAAFKVTQLKETYLTCLHLMSGREVTCRFVVHCHYALVSF